MVVFSLLAPSSAHQNLIKADKILLTGYHKLPSSGTLSAFATSSKLKMLVLTPFKRDSCFKTILGMTYLKESMGERDSRVWRDLPVGWVLNV